MITIKGPDTRKSERFLSGLKPKIGDTIFSGLNDWVTSAHNAAKRNLSGSSGSKPGSYPVPVHTGFLKLSEDYVLPGTSKHGLTADRKHGFLVNTAAYASAIHDGFRTNNLHLGQRDERGRIKKGSRGRGYVYQVGPRPFQKDAANSTKQTAMDRMLIDMHGIMKP